tara:strand:+ start:13 stop:504 length:492 start_codon:yes stop_codon:yes gene_type:complete
MAGLTRSREEAAATASVPTTISQPGLQTAALSTAWTTTMNRFGQGVSSVSASGTNNVFHVTGSGTVLWFFTSYASPSSGQAAITRVDVLFDGVNVLTTPSNKYTSNTKPLNVIGEFHGHLAGTGQGIALNSTAGYNFNESFTIRRNASSNHTAFYISYKILET